MVQEGSPAPDFALQSDTGETVSLSDFRGKPVVLYFYPKDHTSGCTREAQDFTALMPEFGGLGVKLLGISKDPPAKHQKFTAKYDLAVPLATDEDGALMEALGVWVEKSMYGKKYMGIERCTFLIDQEGVVRGVWHKVRVPGHVAEVLKAARAL